MRNVSQLFPFTKFSTIKYRILKHSKMWSLLAYITSLFGNDKVHQKERSEHFFLNYATSQIDRLSAVSMNLFYTATQANHTSAEFCLIYFVSNCQRCIYMHYNKQSNVTVPPCNMCQLDSINDRINPCIFGEKTFINQ